MKISSQYLPGHLPGPFLISERVALARKLEPLFKQEAARRQAHGATGPGRPKQGEKSEPFVVRDMLAARCGLSAKTLYKAMKVIQAAEADPERYEPVARMMDDTGLVDPAYRIVIANSTRRLIKRNRKQPPIFAATKIGKQSLGQLSVGQLGWLMGFFASLAENAAFSVWDATNASELLTVAEVRRAIVAGNRMRKRVS
jgi:hypothetical protein